jgi:UDP-N-acetylglucosamine diphosphorylase / glucose-1-phosphate thymidylyltransferase / UDP-N-acetylgalactosamine diphosphorylase / glucosamine-1-phosphate N-acetyltransferase / galactosamine-1-phosphate N-acetyltransferase
MLTSSSFFDLSEFLHASLFQESEYVWTALTRLKDYMNGYLYPLLKSPLLPEAEPLTGTVVLYEGQVLSASGLNIVYGDTTKQQLQVSTDDRVLTGATVIMAGTVLMGNQIAIGKGVLVESGALIKSPAIIGDYTEIRQGAYLRGYCLAGAHCVIGHTTEVKHSIFLDHAKAGHFAYLGDSILGREVNLGAGTKFANLRFLPGNVAIRTGEGLIDTGRRKFGAILGDKAQTGCNSVTNPGTLIGKEGILMPNTTAPSGFHPPRAILR